jgi:hypothetical protein
MNLAAKFHQTIDSVYAQLDGVSETQAAQPYRPGGWTRKQVLGHLIDSCVNNHVRVVRCVLEKGYTGASYQQDGWVAVHGYDEMSWSNLVAMWRSHNQVLARVIERIPEEAFEYRVEVIDDGSMKLTDWILDYLSHMEHHVDDILGRAAHTQSA